MDEIRKVECCDILAFRVATQNYSEPIVVTNFVKLWPAYSLWSLDYFEKKFGGLVVSVLYSSEGFFRGDPTTGYSKKIRLVRFEKLLAAIRTDKKEYYLAQQPLDSGPFSALIEDIQTPIYIPQVCKVIRNLWLGPSGAITPLHFDIKDNILAQINGRKRVVVFAPCDTKYLRPYAQNSKIPHMSQIDIRNVFFNNPELRDARPRGCTLDAGEMLFLPNGWWHQVQSLAASCSINFWWDHR